MNDDLAFQYRIPGHNRVALTQKLADEIRQHFATDRANRFQLFVLAAGIRNKYLNKKTAEYSDEFREWYEKYSLAKLFGKLPNFTKYASAGDVVAYVAKKTSDPRRYLDQLPTSVGTLYEISLLLKDRETFKLCLNFTAKRKSLDEPKEEWATKQPPLFNPRATEAQIRLWRQNWIDPPVKKKRTDKRTLVLATIRVSGELYDFDKKTGDKTGCVDLPEVEKLLAEISKHFSRTNEKKFLLDSALRTLTEGYYKGKNRYDPAKTILERNSLKKKQKR